MILPLPGAVRFLGLQLGHSRADMARAIMESAAYELRWALERVTAANIPIENYGWLAVLPKVPYGQQF